MPSTCYNSYLDDVFAGNITKTDTYKVMLVDATYTENKDTHSKRSDITGEVTGTGYTAGGQTIVPTFTKDTTNDRLQIVFPQVTWPSSTITEARKAVYYKARGGASSADELVCVDDFGADVTTSSGTFTLQPTTININTPA